MRKLVILSACVGFFLLTAETCERQESQSSSGVKKATASVQTDLTGHTQEQINILEKNKKDSEIGKVRHLYIISSYTGNVLEYYAIRGKVTSGSKRLSPKTASTSQGLPPFEITIGSQIYYTNEVLSDDGTLGESANYYFFFDTGGNYHQVFPAGGTYTRVSDRPLTIKKVSFTLQ